MAANGLLYLVRHAEAAASWGESPDPGLSSLGREQADAVATTLLERLDGTVPQVISSPLARARETAAPLARHLGLDVRIDESFREIPSPVALDQRQAWLRGFMKQQWNQQPESVLAWRERIWSGLSGLPDNSVLFTHFLVINAILAQVLRRESTLVFWPANASVTVLQRDGVALSLLERGEELPSRVN